MRACPPLAPDPGPKATQALTVDTPNRDAHLECQQRQLAAIRFILELIGHGYVLPPASAGGLAAPKP